MGAIIKVRPILLIVPLSILMLAVAGGHVLVWRLFSLSLVVLLLSYLWARLGSRGIEGQLEHLAKHCQAGESFDEEAVIRNASLLPKLLLKVWRIPTCQGIVIGWLLICGHGGHITGEPRSIAGSGGSIIWVRSLWKSLTLLVSSRCAAS